MTFQGIYHLTSRNFKHAPIKTKQNVLTLNGLPSWQPKVNQKVVPIKEQWTEFNNNGITIIIIIIIKVNDSSNLQDGQKSWYLKWLEEAVTCNNKHLPLLPVSMLPWPHPLERIQFKNRRNTCTVTLNTMTPALTPLIKSSVQTLYLCILYGVRTRHRDFLIQHSLILIIKANEMHYFSTLFCKELYMFQTVHHQES